MKVFDLRCVHDHRFEGWFSSDQDFIDQQARGILTCPMCDSSDVVKLPSAPRLNLGHGAGTPHATETPTAMSEDVPSASETNTPLPNNAHITESHTTEALQALWLQAARHLIRNTEDVGSQFATEARKMHHGEAPERAIRGKATAQEVVALQDEGIPVLSVPLPAVTKETLQ